MDYLREGIHLRGFAQIDPLVAYKNEGYKMFEELMASIWEEYVRVIFHVDVDIEPAQVERGFGAESRNRCRRRPTPAAPARSSPSAIARPAPASSRRQPRPGRGGRRRRAGSGNGGERRRQPGDRRQGRGREDRPQRPLLVRLGQEVQEVPRRAERPAGGVLAVYLAA